MMSTRRSLFTLATVGLLAFGMVGSVAAQISYDRIPADTLATTIDAINPPLPTTSGETYSTVKVSWGIGPTYAATCVTESTDASPTADPPRVQCAMDAVVGDQTPLTSFVVYWGSSADFTVANAMDSMSAAVPARTADKPLEASATVKELKPSTAYYFKVAPRNNKGVGAVTASSLVVETKAAPSPDRVTDVMVESRDKGLMVSWEKPHGGDATDGSEIPLKAYHVQYRTSQTASKSAGDWMPADLMDAVVEAPDTDTMLTGLTNDVMHEVRVEAKNYFDATSDGWSRITDDSRGTPMAGAGAGGGDTPTETPALPIAGILALGAGLLAAGRRRLSL